jgi:hypothetical protein
LSTSNSDDARHRIRMGVDDKLGTPSKAYDKRLDIDSSHA